jgi:hypothetical protein
MSLSSWPPLALALWLGLSSACLAAGPGATDRQAATVDSRPLSLDLALRAVGLDGSAAGPATQPAEAGSDRLGAPARERRLRRLDLRLGRAARTGRSPGDPPDFYGEVGVDLDPQAGLSLVPSYRLVLDQSDHADADAIGAQVLKLGARIRF